MGATLLEKIPVSDKEFFFFFNISQWNYKLYFISGYINKPRPYLVVSLEEIMCAGYQFSGSAFLA